MLLSDALPNLDNDLLAMHLLDMKSTNRFHATFAPIASEILRAVEDATYRGGPRTTLSGHLERVLRARIDQPHGGAA